MTTKIIAWFQTLSNFGLLIGLVLVAIQINQSSNIARAQLAHDGWLSSINEETTKLGESPARVLAKMQLQEEQVTDQELLAIDHYLNSKLLHMARVSHMRELGLELWPVEDAAWSYVWFFTGRYGEAWWGLHGERARNMAPEIAARVDAILESGQVDFDGGYLRRFRARLGSVAALGR